MALTTRCTRNAIRARAGGGPMRNGLNARGAHGHRRRGPTARQVAAFRRLPGTHGSAKADVRPSRGAARTPHDSQGCKGGATAPSRYRRPPARLKTERSRRAHGPRGRAPQQAIAAIFRLRSAPPTRPQPEPPPWPRRAALAPLIDGGNCPVRARVDGARKQHCV